MVSVSISKVSSLCIVSNADRNKSKNIGLFTVNEGLLFIFKYLKCILLYLDWWIVFVFMHHVLALFVTWPFSFIWIFNICFKATPTFSETPDSSHAVDMCFYFAMNKWTMINNLLVLNWTNINILLLFNWRKKLPMQKGPTKCCYEIRHREN